MWARLTAPFWNAVENISSSTVAMWRTAPWWSATFRSHSGSPQVPDSTQGQDAVFIGNVNSKKLHVEGCASLPKEENRVYFDSYEEAIRQGYTPCGKCME